MDKKTLRKEMIQKRLSLSQEQFSFKSSIIHQKINQLDIFKNAQSIGIYLSYKNEVDTFKLINQIVSSKDIYVPRIQGKMMDFVAFQSYKDLKENRYGILEPTGNQINNNPDLLIVPLVAYDLNNNRLGYGGGFYDRFLKNYQGTTIGIAFDFQQVKKQKIENQDLPLDIIINDKK